MVNLIIARLQSVNGLTPTGDGNASSRQYLFKYSASVLMALPQQGTETSSIILKKKLQKKVLMALPQQGTETNL